MDGVSRAQLQVRNGTRSIVELLNELRIYYGYDRIEVRTPIVESRMRAGIVAARPLVFEYATDAVILSFTVSMGFPNPSSVTLQLSAVSGFDIPEQELVALQARCQTIALEFTTPKDCFGKILSEVAGVTKQAGAEGPLCSAVEGLNVCSDLDDNTGEIPAFYHCRKCRYLLFDSMSFNDHSSLPHENPDGCTSFFLEEAPGYVAIDDLDAGKINCPKCGSRVGAWSWVGTTCSCNAWIAPAFQVTKSKVERKF